MGLTPIDFWYLAKELKTLENSALKSITREENFFFEFEARDKKLLLVVAKDYAYITERIPTGEPDGFCNFLLNYLKKKRVSKVEQNKFNKIIVLDFSEFILIFEFIGKGNIILCDQNLIVIGALLQREFKDRKILAKEKYTFPDSPDLDKFEEIKDEKTLAKELHIGQIYAHEISEGNLTIKKLLERNPAPRIYFQENGGKIPAPFEIETLTLKSEAKSTLSEAIEEAFSVKRQTKTEIIKNGREKSLNKFEKEAKEFEEKASLLMANICEIENAVQAWKKEKRISGPLKSVNEKTGSAKISIEGKEIEIPLAKEPKVLVKEYFDKAKKARAKTGKTKEWLDKKIEEKKPQKRTEKKAEWFDQFKNFVTSDGFLVIIGKDATTNEKLIKKYCKPKDIVLHAHIPGSPFAVIRSEGRVVSEEAIREAAQFTANYSRFWISRLGIADMYWVTPEQVSKTPLSGEYLAKGSFMIYGKRNFLRVELRLAIGVDENFEVIRGVRESLEKRAKYFVEIVPGSREGKAFAEEIKAVLVEKAKGEDKEKIMQINSEEFLKFVPYGKGEMAKS